MADISEAARLKACELAIQKGSGAGRDFDGPGGLGIYTSGKALAEYIQQVSDAAKAVRAYVNSDFTSHPSLELLAPFILPDPVDPLRGEAETLASAWVSGELPDDAIAFALAALTRGMELARSADHA